MNHTCKRLILGQVQAFQDGAAAKEQELRKCQQELGTYRELANRLEAEESKLKQEAVDQNAEIARSTVTTIVKPGCECLHILTFCCSLHTLGSAFHSCIAIMTNLLWN